MNTELTIDYIRERGNHLDQARLAYLLYRDAPSKEVLELVLAGQRNDGGWAPTWAADYSSLDATCFRFAQAQQLGLTAANVALARACEFFSRRQKEDGSWEETKEQALAAPDWVKPGRRSARLYLTANCGFWLSVMDGSQSGVLTAASLLRRHLGKGSGLPSYFQTQWLSAALFYRLKWYPQAEILLTYLRDRLGAMSSSHLAWMLLSLNLADLPCENFLLEQGAALLERTQRNDGSWPGDGAPSGDINTTLEVMFVLHQCNRL
ncbi:hypothetical protein ACFLZW_01630 [Chloroflexota bacterium]